MSDSPTSTFSPSSSKSQTSTLQANLHTCEPCGTSYQQMAESQNLEEGSNVCFTQQQDSTTFSLRTAALDRRHSADGAISPGSGSVPGQGSDSERFHPYRRQFSDGAVKATGCLQHCPSPYSCLQEVSSADTCSAAHSSSSEAPTSWDQFSGSFQASRLMGSPHTYPELPAAPVEPTCFLSQSHTPCSSASPLQQFSSRLYSANGQSNSSKYSVQCLSAPSHQDSTQSLFPKPIYSYSILIFMALRNSKTGSLPVSEIYSFMTEHFPYFKTAPDGWKNSVRHNLSLNKCFEKVENKSGNSSRKGCLWALNPAKVEKMQEELHKWRRKDPVTVRKSMARPEDLDRLLGERPEKLKSLPLYSNPTLLSRLASTYDTTASSFAPPQLREPCLPIRRPQYSHVPAPSQHPCYLPPAAPHPSNPFSLYSPCGQQASAGVPSTMGGLNSPTAGKMPPVYSATLQAEYSIGARSMQEFLLEGDASYDIDTLNPSLTDLQLQGNLWEELREDSLSDPLAVSTTSALPVSHVQTSSLQAAASVSQTSEMIAIGRRKGEVEDDIIGSSLEHINGLHPMVYSGVESLAGYLTSCTTSISLL
ncbi:forkhead box protein N1 [Centroberyx affinis]|uniref:forkhead box protein N1 n=1 Tax=Centroberyx affinis TaxID=166261 RepID=UPI003A5C1818